ncbi:MAG: type IV pilus twitching motility protein PilT [Candidatus Omnitrophota bacterium]
MVDLQTLLKDTIKRGASDLHITYDSVPIVRVDGALVRLAQHPMLTQHDCKMLVYSILNDKQKAKFERELELDFSLAIPSLNRFRVNVHMQRGSVEAAFRTISTSVPTVQQLGLPPAVTNICRKKQGLIIVTGPTGVGKTSTLAAMVDYINNKREEIIMIIEDPVEYIHKNKMSVIKQREVFSDTHSFASALRYVLRQDPDVIVVGEMRDLETISTTLTAAETGHLVLATLHTPDAAQTVDRMIDVFPPHQQEQIRVQLASSLEAVVSQLLLPRADGRGRVLATEVMICTPAVRNLIRNQETEQLLTQMQTGYQYGMHTMDKSLKELLNQNIISQGLFDAYVKSIEASRSL